MWLFVFINFILISKEKAKRKQHKKLGEDEETIPPEYRLTDAKVINLEFCFSLTFRSLIHVDETETVFHFDMFT